MRYAASTGYVAYRYTNDPAAREIRATITGSGNSIDCPFLLPPQIESVKSVEVNNTAVHYDIVRSESSHYADFVLDNTKPRTIIIRY